MKILSTGVWDVVCSIGLSVGLIRMLGRAQGPKPPATSPLELQKSGFIISRGTGRSTHLSRAESRHRKLKRAEEVKNECGFRS